MQLQREMEVELVAERGRNSVLDAEAAFVSWYHDGRRRSYREVAQLFGVSYERVRRAAFDHDWGGRASKLDRDARAIVDRQLAAFRAQAITRLAELPMAQLARFAQRLPDTVKDESGTLIRNPYLAEPGELTVADVARATKMLVDIGVLQPTLESPFDEQREAWDEMESQIRAMDELEAQEKRDAEQEAEVS